MKTINISKQKYNGLELLELHKSIVGTEAQMYIFNYLNQLKLFKRLYSTNGIYFANKLYTLEMIKNYKNLFPSSFVVPDAIVSVAGTIKGFTVPYVNGINLKTLLDNSKINNDEKLLYLKKIGVVLDKMKDVRNHTELDDFYINDLHENNFMIDPISKKIYVIDVDSIKIAGNQSFASRYLTSNSLYIKNNKNQIKINEKSDLYCYSTCILNFLYKEKTNTFTIEEYFEYLNYLESLNINKELMNFFETSISPASTINPYPYLESLTDSQIGRASSNVYKIVR